MICPAQIYGISESYCELDNDLWSLSLLINYEKNIRDLGASSSWPFACSGLAEGVLSFFTSSTSCLITGQSYGYCLHLKIYRVPY